MPDRNALVDALLQGIMRTGGLARGGMGYNNSQQANILDEQYGRDPINRIGPEVNFAPKNAPVQPLPTILPGGINIPQRIQEPIAQAPVSLPQDIAQPVPMDSEASKKTGILEILKNNADWLVPLVAAGVGIAGKGGPVTAGAAGFAGGFNQGRQQAFENQMKQRESLRDTEMKDLNIKKTKQDIDYMNRINKRLDEQGGKADIVYRDPITGEEVPQDKALSDIRDGRGTYVVNQRVYTKSGVVERNIVKPENLTNEEKNYINTSGVVLDTLDSLKNMYSDLYSKGQADWSSLQAEKLPYYLAKDQSVQDLKSALTSIKAQIPFLRGGKQLTEGEARRIDVLLNPFGKSEETYNQDIERFNKEFTGGANIMKYGLSPAMSKSSNQPYSNKIGRFIVEAE